MKRLLTDPTLPDVFVAGFRERMGEETTRTADMRDPELVELEKRAHNLGDAVAVAGWSVTLGEQLKAVEEKLAKLRAVAVQDERSTRTTVVDRARS